MSKHTLRNWILVVVCFPALGLAQAVRFDLPPMGECYDVADPEFEQLHPGERLIQLPLEIAADIGLRHGDSIDMLVLQIVLVADQATIFDYSPRNICDSDIEGLISIEQSNDVSGTMGVKTSAVSGLPVQLESQLGMSNKQARSVRFQQKPQQQLVVSSGFLGRRTGIFVKLRRSTQQSLEGVHPINLVLRVPSNWRTGFLRVQCTSLKTNSPMFGDAERSVDNQVGYLIPMMMSNDEDAHVLARALRKAEIQFRESGEKMMRQEGKANLLDQLQSTFNPHRRFEVDEAWLARMANAVEVSAREAENLPRELAIRLKDLQFQKSRFASLTWETPVTRSTH